MFKKNKENFRLIVIKGIYYNKIMILVQGLKKLLKLK